MYYFIKKFLSNIRGIPIVNSCNRIKNNYADKLEYNKTSRGLESIHFIESYTCIIYQNIVCI